MNRETVCRSMEDDSMLDRRSYTRELIDARTRLYHPMFGALDGAIKDISSNGVFVRLRPMPESVPMDGEGHIELKLLCMDVIFNMKCIRYNKHGMVLGFVEEH